MKIHIIGGPGSGKSFLAEKLSKKYNIAHYDLDDLQWDNKASDYGTKRSSQERAHLLDTILKTDHWIIEGVYFSWCRQCFADADKIYLLNGSLYQCRYRIIRRFFRRKLGMEKGKRESFKSLWELLKWTEKYQKENMVEIRKLLSKYPDKVMEESMMIDCS